MALFNDISNFVNKALGIDTDVSGIGSASFQPPWTTDPSQNKEEAFWRPIQLDPKRWNKLYPYRLLVVDVSKPGTPRVVSGKGSSRSKTDIESSPEQGTEYMVNQVAES